MPWSFKAAIAMLVLAGLGSLLIARACFESGWDALGHLAWGQLTTSLGLCGGLVMAIVCAATQPKWRVPALTIAGASFLLLGGLVLFARSA